MLKKVIFCSLLLTSLSYFCYSQAYYEGFEYIADGVMQPLIIHSEKAEAEKLKSHWQAIGEELRTTDSEFAGTYAKHGYRGWYLRLSPDNGFVYIFHYENIDIIDYSYGKVKIENSEVTLVPEREMQQVFRDKKLFTPKSWITIGNYLIPKENAKDFADYLSGLDKYNTWNCECDAFFSKKSSSESPKFVIPKEYKHLFKPPIEGKIVSVGKSYFVKEADFGPHIETPVKVDIGKLHGVTEGLTLRVFKDDFIREIIVYKVFRNFAWGKISDFSYDEGKMLTPTYYDSELGKDKPIPPIRLGTKVTTKLFSY